MKRILVLNLTTAALASAAFAAGDAANLNAVPKIERLALFKNGLGYATATATLPPKATTVRIGQLPVPAYGTFWVGYSKDVKLRNLTTAMETVDELIPVSRCSLCEQRLFHSFYSQLFILFFVPKTGHVLRTQNLKSNPQRRAALSRQTAAVARNALTEGADRPLLCLVCV